MSRIIIALGENARFRSGKNEIAKDPSHLSVHGKIVSQALLSFMNKDDIAVLSGGFTTGKKNGTEAEAMRNYIHFLNPKFDTSRLILEEKSNTTQTNAKEVKNIVEKLNKEQLILLAPGFHLKRAVSVFKNHGLKVKPISAEDVLGNSKEYKSSFPYKVEKIKETVLNFLLIFDSEEKVQQKLAELTRK